MHSADDLYMAEALRQAAEARGRTAPNPMVGAVCVAAGRVVGTGFHPRAGAPHAEPLALAEAGAKARGATLYVTLEPCHHHGRTPPCTEAILAAGVARVVVGAPDNDARVDGRGIAFLRARGVDVRTGVLATECLALNEAYHHAKACGRPLVVAKWAQSLDGCIGAQAGEQTWLTGPEARYFAHRLRNALDGVAVGRHTVAIDDPALTCRGVAGGRDPVRVVFDTEAQLSLAARVVTGVRRSAAGTWVVCAEDAPASRQQALTDAGVVVLTVPRTRGRACLTAGLEALAARGLHSLLLEGGPTLLGAAFDAQLVARAYCFVAPVVVGSEQAPRAVLGQGVHAFGEAARLEPPAVRQLGADVLIYGRVANGRLEA